MDKLMDRNAEIRRALRDTLDALELAHEYAIQAAALETEREAYRDRSIRDITAKIASARVIAAITIERSMATRAAASVPSRSASPTSTTQRAERAPVKVRYVTAPGAASRPSAPVRDGDFRIEPEPFPEIEPEPLHDDLEDALTLPALAHRLGVSESQVYRWKTQGYITVHGDRRPCRVDPKDSRLLLSLADTKPARFKRVAPWISRRLAALYGENAPR